MIRLFASISMLVALTTSAGAAGIDETINNLVQPITNITSSIVFFKVCLSG